MFQPKLGSERSKEWRCCLCLHVRTGTILLGSWHLMLHLMTLVLLTAAMKDPRLWKEIERDDSSEWGDFSSMPAPLATPESSRYPYHHNTVQRRDHSLIYVCTLVITLMLVYGAARGKPAHLLPFFCMQIFDFAITVLTALSYLCYVRSMQLAAQADDGKVVRIPEPANALLFMASVLIKGYFISVVWRCYKYLTMRAVALHSLAPFVIAESAPPPPGAALPRYDDVVKHDPPPSYRDAAILASAPLAEGPQMGTENNNIPAPTATMVVLPQRDSRAV